jgi:hypothetical protein
MLAGIEPEPVLTLPKIPQTAESKSKKFSRAKFIESDASLKHNKSFDLPHDRSSRIPLTSNDKSVIDRSTEPNEMQGSRTESKDRFPLTTTKRLKNALSTVAEAIPPKQRAEMTEMEIKNLLQLGIFEVNSSQAQLKRDNTGLERGTTPKPEDGAQTPVKYISSRMMEPSFKSALARRSVFVKKEQILEELDKKSKTKTLNI